MKKKKLLSIAFVVSLLPMLLNQYGGESGVDGVSGLINLLNPIGIVSAALFIVSVWVPFRKENMNKMLGLLSTVGMIAAELYQFFTWHVLTITGAVSLQNSIALAFPTFYVGLAVSGLMVIIYLIIQIKIAD